jgi:hypothetical protein
MTKHTQPLGKVPGAYLTREHEYLPLYPCPCPSCQAAHAAADKTPESPFNIADRVTLPGIGPAIIYLTDADRSYLYLVEERKLAGPVANEALVLEVAE